MGTRIQTIGAALAGLLIAGVLSCPAVAQAGGAITGSGMVFGGTGGGAGAGHGGGTRFGGAHSGGGFRQGRRFNRDRGGDVIVAPLWYDGWGGWYDEPYSDERPEPPAQTIIMPPPRPEPVRVPPDPKVVEVPGAATAPAAKKLPPALFILNNGERIEAQHYLISADRVQLTTDRRLRTILLSELNLNATLAADRQRGIDLHVPSGGSEISLGF
jgi:hypothetical protein